MVASYLKLSAGELEERVRRLEEILKRCRLCPRQCEVKRLQGEKGFCRLGVRPRVASYHPHFGEERCLVGSRGSGTIFFSSCNLACIYCQNYEISQLREGREVSVERLAEMMLALQERGCHNINLVTPTPQVYAIVRALVVARRKGLRLPLVYNTSAYDAVETLKCLEGIIDIYMPDLKYADDKYALRFSFAPRYFTVAKKAVREMHRQVGDLSFNQEGLAQRGLLVRHLVLPHNIAGSKKILDFLAHEISPHTFVNIMNQYFPHYRAATVPALSRPVRRDEYDTVVRYAKKLGLRLEEDKMP
jgi:putative pyruvate formate lyase activating enzyme